MVQLHVIAKYCDALTTHFNRVGEEIREKYSQLRYRHFSNVSLRRNLIVIEFMKGLFLNTVEFYLMA